MDTTAEQPRLLPALALIVERARTLYADISRTYPEAFARNLAHVYKAGLIDPAALATSGDVTLVHDVEAIGRFFNSSTGFDPLVIPKCARSSAREAEAGE